MTTRSLRDSKMSQGSLCPSSFTKPIVHYIISVLILTRFRSGRHELVPLGVDEVP